MTLAKIPPSFLEMFDLPPALGKADIQIFSKDGKWTRPVFAQNVLVLALGAAGGGAGGRGGTEGAAISFHGAATGVTSATLPTHQAGDLILAFAYRDGSDTLPTIPTGWTAIGTRGIQANSSVVAYRIAADGATVSGTWTSATSVIFQVYRGVHLNYGVSLNPQANGTNGSSTTVIYPGLVLRAQNGSSWVAAFAGHRSTNTALENAPTGMVNRANVADATDEASGHDTNGGVNSWPSTNVGVAGTASGWHAWSVELESDQGQIRQGGTGGGGGCYLTKTILADNIPDEIDITVGVGGDGGNGGSAANGSDGTDGTLSSFGPYIIAYGGGAGNGGSNSATRISGGTGGGSGSGGITGSDAYVSGGSPWFNGTTNLGYGISTGGAGAKPNKVGLNSEYGGASGGGNPDTDAFGIVALDGGSSIFGGPGGGAGGNINTKEQASAGGAGGTVGSYTAGGGGAAGTLEGGLGGKGVQIEGFVAGKAGGGGAAHRSGTGGKGGDGGLGAGGGGGAGGTTVGGAGEKGGDGLVVVISY